ncbi:alpha/beta hydrolase [Microbacterium murale]|uniref:Lysophospholipase n=1 Tax=Microbacterium murale TaxID=1081040 RepID=A0ABQ1RTX1_9MICO|nr:lysophospholipase [Microbacterium murale]GGD82527.1 hypothetical protein GCM10007269_26710 [Microbacterium murale]
MTTSSPAAVWTPPARVRGTIAVVTGRGEGAPVYERFGKRLSADGYTVAVFEADADAAASWLANTEDAPRVLVGSDTGAAGVLRVLAEGETPDGAIIAGTPVDVDTDQPADEERTACPVHLGVLGTAEARTAPATAEPVPAAPDLAAIAVPVLAFHGSADTVSPIAEAGALLAAVPDIELIETVDGLHDALNDQSHRSVAASIVLWLERLRSGDVHAPVVRVSTGVLAA